MNHAHQHAHSHTAGHSHGHDFHGGHAPHKLPFTDAEWQSLQASDMAASRSVVTLLLGVFCIGVVLYSIVCVAVYDPESATSAATVPIIKSMPTKSAH